MTLFATFDGPKAVGKSTLISVVQRNLFDRGFEPPPRQNRCRSHRTLNLGALMEEQVGQIRTSIQGQSGGAVAAA